MRESGVPGGGYKEVTVPVGSNDVTYNLNTDVFDENKLMDSFVKLNNTTSDAEAVLVLGENVREDDGRYIATIDEDSQATYVDSAENLASAVRNIITMIQNAHEGRLGSFSDDFQYRETRYFVDTQSDDLDETLSRLERLFNYKYFQDTDRNMLFPFNMSAERYLETVTGNNSLALERMRDVITDIDRYARDSQNEGNADIADIAEPLQAMSLQAKRIFNSLLESEQQWMYQNIMNELQFEPGQSPATRVEFTVQPFAIDEE